MVHFDQAMVWKVVQLKDLKFKLRHVFYLKCTKKFGVELLEEFFIKSES